MADPLAGVVSALTQAQELVETARSMPMSASCVVHRADLLALLDEVRDRLPVALDRAEEVLEDKDAVVEQGRLEAEAIIADARAERRRMLAETDLMRAAQEEGERIVEDARRQADEMRVEVEDYVDAKLANFEIVLAKTMQAVERGREKLSGRHELDALREPAHADDPLPS